MNVNIDGWQNSLTLSYAEVVPHDVLLRVMASMNYVLARVVSNEGGPDAQMPHYFRTHVSSLSTGENWYINWYSNSPHCQNQHATVVLQSLYSFDYLGGQNALVNSFVLFDETIGGRGSSLLQGQFYEGWEA